MSIARQTRHARLDVLLFVAGACLTALITHAWAAGDASLAGRLVGTAGLLSSMLMLLAPRLMTSGGRCKLALLVGSCIVALYAGEAAVRLVDGPQLPSDPEQALIAARAAAARRAGGPFDRRHWLEVLVGLRRDGFDVLPNGTIEAYLHEEGFPWADSLPDGASSPMITIGGQQLLPLGHPSFHLMLGLENENGYWPLIETDEHGFRNPPGLWSRAPVQLMAVGDSFTEGSTVRAGESFVDQLRSRFPVTVNLGLGGGGPLSMLACIREYGPVLRPKVVLWCFFEGNDLADLASRLHAAPLADYLDPDCRKGLVDHQVEIDAAVKQFLEHGYRWLQAHRQTAGDQPADRIAHADRCRDFLALQAIRSKLRSLARLVEQGAAEGSCFGEPVGPHWAMTWKPLPPSCLNAFHRVLATAHKDVQQWGGRMYLVYLPSWNRVADPQFAESVGRTTDRRDYRPQVLQLARSLQIPCIDLVPVFAGHPDPLSLFPYRLFGHYNAAGHRLVARQIAARLVADRETD